MCYSLPCHCWAGEQSSPLLAGSDGKGQNDASAPFRTVFVARLPTQVEAAQALHHLQASIGGGEGIEAFRKARTVVVHGQRALLVADREGDPDLALSVLDGVADQLVGDQRQR